MKLYTFNDKNASYCEATDVVVLSESYEDAKTRAIKFMEKERTIDNKGVNPEDVVLVKEFDMTKPQIVAYTIPE